MKKLFAFMLIFSSILALRCINSFAAPLPVDQFSITGGIDAEKVCDITFDTTRLISGTASKNTVVTITVFDVTNPENRQHMATYQQTVGSAGIFSQCICLNEGKNYVVVAAANGEKYSEISTTISRKGRVIKAVLSQYIALPGQTGR